MLLRRGNNEAAPQELLNTRVCLPKAVGRLSGCPGPAKAQNYGSPPSIGFRPSFKCEGWGGAWWHQQSSSRWLRRDEPFLALSLPHPF